MAKVSQSREKAEEWVCRLTRILWEMDRMDRRTSKEATKILRDGCSTAVNGTSDRAEKAADRWREATGWLWDPDLDSAEALLALSNRLAWNAFDADRNRFSLDDIYNLKETK